MTNKKLLELAIHAALLAGERTLKFYHEELDVIIKDDNSPLTQADLESNQVIMDILTETDIPILSEENKIVAYEEREAWKTFWLIDPLDGTKEFINKRSEYTINIALIDNGTPVMGVVFAPVLKTLYYGLKEEGSFKVLIEEMQFVSKILETSERLSAHSVSKKLNIVASRSHLSDETKDFIASLEKYHGIKESKSYGSSLKLCMVAEGTADIYPRLGPTMEWDTAASHAVAIYAGSSVIEAEKAGPLVYNKENLLNPYFIVYNPALDKTVRRILNKD